MRLYKKVLDDSSIEGNCLKKDTIFTFSVNHISKINEWFKTKNDFTYKNAKQLKKYIEGII